MLLLRPHALHLVLGTLVVSLSPLLPLPLAKTGANESRLTNKMHPYGLHDDKCEDLLRDYPTKK